MHIVIIIKFPNQIEKYNRIVAGIINARNFLPADKDAEDLILSP